MHRDRRVILGSELPEGQNLTSPVPLPALQLCLPPLSVPLPSSSHVHVLGTGAPRLAWWHHQHRWVVDVPQMLADLNPVTTTQHSWRALKIGSPDSQIRNWGHRGLPLTPVSFARRRMRDKTHLLEWQLSALRAEQWRSSIAGGRVDVMHVLREEGIDSDSALNTVLAGLRALCKRTPSLIAHAKLACKQQWHLCNDAHPRRRLSCVRCLDTAYFQHDRKWLSARCNARDRPLIDDVLVGEVVTRLEQQQRDAIARIRLLSQLR